MKKLLTLLVVLLAMASMAHAAGTISCVKQGGDTARYVCSAVADATNATGTVVLSGRIVRVVTEPGSGAATPSAVWSCTLVDEYSVDVMGGAIASADTNSSEQFFALHNIPTSGSVIIQPYTMGAHTLTCTAIGDENTADVIFFVEELN